MHIRKPLATFKTLKQAPWPCFIRLQGNRALDAETSMMSISRKNVYIHAITFPIA